VLPSESTVGPFDSRSTVNRLRLLVAAVLALAGVCAAGGSLRAQATAAPPVLNPGDAIRVTVWRQPELSGEFEVLADGTIAHPLLRGVRVTDVPLSVAEERVGDYLARLETTPQFVVQPLLRVAVGGEVRQPSLYRLPPATSIAEAIALAGGATERGRLERVRLFRDGREVQIDLTRPEAGAAQGPIRSGDQIFVDRRVSIFRDYIAPAGSITAALVSLLTFALR
jgi:polysaccharide export outer membrane protein